MTARDHANAVLNSWVDSMGKMPDGINLLELACLKTFMEHAFQEYESQIKSLEWQLRSWQEGALR